MHAEIKFSQSADRLARVVNQRGATFAVNGMMAAVGNKAYSMVKLTSV